MREIYDMQANRRKATWVIMQKLVVNDYALGMLVLKVPKHPTTLTNTHKHNINHQTSDD
jgi:hypothetical protein